MQKVMSLFGYSNRVIVYMKKLFVVCLICCGGISLARAGIVAEKKRIIFNEGEHQQTLIIANSNTYPILMQTWIDDGNIQNNPSYTVSPFIITPPISNLLPKEIKSLRLLLNPQQILPKDRESAFWINLYEVPPINKANQPADSVIMAMNTQIKLFYRPTKLKNKPDEKELAAKLICYGKNHNKLITINCQNPTRYYVSLSNIELTFNNKRYQNEVQLDMMVPPLGENNYLVETDLLVYPKQMDVQYSMVNDHGDVEGITSIIALSN